MSPLVRGAPHASMAATPGSETMAPVNAINLAHTTNDARVKAPETKQEIGERTLDFRRRRWARLGNR
ncbi:MAG: hypothetical protein AAF253_12605 [Pseudomonadota bacterium]